MKWDDKPTDLYKPPETVVDVAFNIDCKSIPIDHAYAHSTAVTNELSWISEDPTTAIHLIHGAESGNGWERPTKTETTNPALYLSRRSKLTIRIPRNKIDEIKKLVGVTLNIEQHPLTVKDMVIKKINVFPILFSRYIMIDQNQSEDDFLEQIHKDLKAEGITCWKMMCGKSQQFSFPGKEVYTRSLMIADLDPEESIKLQYQGYGEGLKFGCGIFLAHKEIDAVQQKQSSNK